MKKDFSLLKCAIIHDSLIEFGGAERVLFGFIKLFPNSDIYTLVADSKALKTYFSDLNNSKLKICISSRHINNGSVLQLLAPIFWKRLRLEQYDLVIASSSYLMSNTVSVIKPIFIQYIHSPPKNLFGAVKKNRLQSIFDYSFIIRDHYLKSIKSSPYIIANSEFTSNVLHNTFNLSAKVIYPPVRIPAVLPIRKKDSFFLSVSRIRKIKNLELIIKACNKIKIPLKIIGSGTDSAYESKLKSIAGPSVDFLGFVSNSELDKYFDQATALICASDNEDFGISAVEAQAHGLPVIAYNSGGYRETIVNGKTGLFFKEMSENSLINAIKTFKTMSFDQIACINNAKKFSSKEFDNKIISYISSIFAYC